MIIGDINSALFQTLGIFSMASSIFFIYTFVKAINSKFGFKYNILFFTAAFSNLAFYEMMYLVNKTTWKSRTPVNLRSRVVALHVSYGVIISLILLSFLIFSAAVFIKKLKSEKNVLTPDSLQEGMDNLEDGILYATSDGIPLLVNKKMHLIIRAAFNTAVFDVCKLEEMFKNGELYNGCVKIEKDKNTFLQLSDGSVYNFVKNNLTANKKQIVEIIAYDITELYNKYLELEKRTQHLDEVNRQLKKYNREINKTVREKEILTAKIKLHDDLGRALLTLRAYLTERLTDRASLISMWEFTISVLRREAEFSNTQSEFDILKIAAEEVGIELCLTNGMPEALTNNKVIINAIHECLTNTVKHANGTKLFINTKTDSGKTTVEITNDGTPPKGVISETGGLKNLRKLADSENVKMEIQSQPYFKLTLIFNF